MLTASVSSLSQTWSAPRSAIAAPSIASTAQNTASTASEQPPPKLVIELDHASQRFVQSLIDDVAHSILFRYPNEQQLAFSRGVNAYVRAMRLKLF